MLEKDLAIKVENVSFEVKKRGIFRSGYRDEFILPL